MLTFVKATELVIEVNVADVGLALDLRMLERFAVDLVLGYFGQLVHERFHADAFRDQLAQRFLQQFNEKKKIKQKKN